MKTISNLLFIKHPHQLLFFLGFILLLLIYYISMPKTVVLADDGLFILSAFFNGVSHPPGYPLHSVIGYFSTLFPPSNVAVKIHMVSAFFGALASLLASFFVYSLYKNIVLSLLTLFVVGLGQGFWSQSIISEVYTFNAFFVILLMLLIFKFKLVLTDETIIDNKTSIINKYIFYIFLCVGLGLSNHWPLFILGGAGCVVIIPYVLPYKKYLTKICIGLIGLCIGLLPYVWLIYNSNNDPFISFVGPLNDFSEFYDFLSRKIYRDGVDSSADANIFDKVSYIKFGLIQSITEHSYLGSLFVVVGLIYFFKNNFNSKLFLSCFVLTPLLLPVLLNKSYTDWYMITYKPFLLVPYMFSGMLLSIGAYKLVEKFNQKNIALVSLVVFIIGSGIYLSSTKNYRNNYDYSLEYAYTVLDALDENSVLIIGGDVQMSTLPYVRYILKYRPDVKIINQNGRVLNTRIFDSRNLSVNDVKLKVLQYIKESSHSIYLTSFLPGVGLENHWLYYKVNKSYKNNKVALVDISKHNKFLSRVLYNKKDLDDEWTNDFNELLKTAAIPSLFRSIVKANNEDDKLAYSRNIKLLFYDVTNFIHAGVYIKQFSLFKYFGGKEKLNDIGDKLFFKENDNVKRAGYLNFKAQNSLINNKYHIALNFYQLSINEWNSKKNNAIEQVKSLCKINQLQNSSVCDDMITNY